ncbi:DUF397 domain-containing protein [Streptomyces hirsutus]|uniref:DUF397 domain-containing protein n=1 Tax=Streptomyces hirsutus TaxID=35620 RepID=UPI0036530BF4
MRYPMAIPTRWRKSSYSGGGEGNDCVEISNLGGCIAIRDSKVSSRTPLSVATPAFASFVDALKASQGRLA